MTSAAASWQRSWPPGQVKLAVVCSMLSSPHRSGQRVNGRWISSLNSSACFRSTSCC